MYYIARSETFNLIKIVYFVLTRIYYYHREKYCVLKKVEILDLI